jgi:hypothetical protein
MNVMYVLIILHHCCNYIYTIHGICVTCRNMNISHALLLVRMGDRRDLMYEGFKKGGCHTSEWFVKTQMFLEHAAALSQLDNIRCPCNKCRNMTSHTKR